MSKVINLNVPMLPLRDVVVFPSIVVPLFVGREPSIKAIEKAIEKDRTIFLATQRDAAEDAPSARNLYQMGVLAKVVQMIKLPDSTLKVLVEGVSLAKLFNFKDGEIYLADIEQVPEKEDKTPAEEIEGISRALVSSFEHYCDSNKKLPNELMSNVEGISDQNKLSYTIATYLPVRIDQKQEILEELLLGKRLEKLIGMIEGEVSVLEVESKIRDRVKGQMEKNQRDYYLNEQLKAIHKELGDKDEDFDEIAEYEDKIHRVKLTKEAREKAVSELRKLKNMSPLSAEATVVRNYLDWLLAVPWNKNKKRKIDIKKAHTILNQDHESLEKIKERILEYIAVQSRLKTAKGQILCFVGPPGVGKTSLAESIARATGRDYVRMSLGGVRDESEIRGHRRTYIGSMPGRIIQGMKKAKTSNPLFLLDEIDKMSQDWRGDPSSALLEVLDPAQNKSFNDHYLEVDYDLSKVMFIATANTLNLPQPLLDRMEVIRLSGYTEEEKLTIAQNHLLKRARGETGVTESEVIISKETIQELIRYYTREAGVRNLYRELVALCRKALKEMMEKEQPKVEVTPEKAQDYLGVRRFKYGEIEEKNLVGITTGLAWTEVGGDLLQVEAVVVPGKGKKIITGKLGDVMKESVEAAYTYIQSRCFEFGVPPTVFEKQDIHIHVPEGATPKDGPSAGIAMCTSITSALTSIPVRRDVAMTGEVTLRGRVLQIGGLKEKLLAAHRGGIKKVLIPEDNVKDLTDIPENVKKDLEIIPVNHVDQVIPHALTHKPVPLDREDFTKSTAGEKAEKHSKATSEKKEELKPACH